MKALAREMDVQPSRVHQLLRNGTFRHCRFSPEGKVYVLREWLLEAARRAEVRPPGSPPEDTPRGAP